MARIPRAFQKLEPGHYRFGRYLIRKDGVTRQDGSVVATYVATDERGIEIIAERSAQAMFTRLAAIDAIDQAIGEAARGDSTPPATP